MVINKEQAHLKNILHREVAIVLHNHKKQYLINYKTIKNTNNYMLNLSATGIVRASESRLEAASRALEIKDIFLVEGGKKLPNPKGKSILDNTHLTLFFAKIGNNIIYNEQNNLKDSILLDRDELTGIASHSPSLLSDLLYWSISTNALFEHNIN